MKRYIGWIVGVALTASLAAAPTVIAQENGEVHHWSSGYSRSDGTTNVVERGDEGTMVRVVGPGMMMAPGSRVYFINDDPDYDLSGSGDHWFLVGNGTSFHDNNWKNSASFAGTTGPARSEFVPISAEYRQDWLAVAAGDRPVRTLTPPGSTMEATPMSYSYSSTQYTENGAKYRSVQPRRTTKVYRTTSTARYSATHRTHKRQHVAVATTHKRYRSASVATTPARHSYSRTMTVREKPTTAVVAAAPEVRYDQFGHQIFQIHNSWYMKNNGEWLRAESWRGPFVRVGKGMVPREVKMSAKRPSRVDMD